MSRVVRRVLTVLAVTLGVVGLEHLFFRYLLADLTWNPAGLWAHGALDVGLLFPLTFGALALGLALARRGASGVQGWEPLLTAVGAASLVFALGVGLTAEVRDGLHEELGVRFDLPLVLETTDDALAGETDAASLCSYKTLRGGSSADGETAGAAWTERLADAAERAAIAQGAFVPLLLLVWIFGRRRELAWRVKWTRGRRRRVFRTVRWAAVLAVAALLVNLGTRAESADVSGLEFMAFDACLEGGPTRSYNVHAIEIEMTINRFGDHDPGAFMYVLENNIQAVRDQEATQSVSAGLRKDPIQPLVIRANLGECVTITFTNDLPADPASMHFLGLPHTAANAGGETGFNPPSTAAPNGGVVMYQLSIPADPEAERAYYFYDHGASRQRVSRGLFGALVVEPAGSSHLDPETGATLQGSNWEAIIVDPAGENFREFVLIYHEIGDESFAGIQRGGGGKLPQLDNASSIYRPGARAINYRSEPFLNRMDLKQDKSLGYSSYTYGDPGMPIPRSYLGEPTKTRLVHGGSELFHVHHLHGGAIRWRRNPMSDPNTDISSGLNKEPAQNVFSTHLDSQSIGPGTSYNLLHECGAGGCQQSAGDFLFHCHIGQHYIAGMWSFWRVFDTDQADLAPVPTAPAASAGVSAWELLFANSGRTYDGKELVLTVTNPSTQMLLSDWLDQLLPPQGVRLDDQDAAVWDWIESLEGGDPSKPIVLGEPEDSTVWANFQSPTPGQRPEVLFNLENGRYAWPLLRPHLGQRPPFAPNGHSGAPWLGEDGTSIRPDGLCPDDSQLALPEPTRKTRVYPITAINVPIQVTDGGTDTNGKIFVLNEDKDEVLAGTKPRVPLAIRSNVQDCVDVILTSELPDSSASTGFSKVNMHTHFVQFDPQASDGVITGLSYEQSVRPYETENRTLSNSTSAGATSITVSDASRLRTGIWIGVGLGEGICTNPGGGDDVACTEIRRITAINGTTVTLHQSLDLTHAQGEAVGVEFVRYKWYSDVDTGTVFWHDHVDFFNWDHGLFGAHVIEPAGSTYHDPTTGVEVRSGAIVDIHAPSGASVGAGQSGSFREFLVFLHNNNPVTGGINEGGTINLRAEPWGSRSGSAAHRFSSVLHDDPLTPLPRAYVGDPFVIRGLGVVERVGGLRVSGHRFRLERFAGSAPFADTAPIGISERFDLVLDGGAGGPNGTPGDYLYYSTIERDFEAGAWGILRVHDTLQGDLQVLPDQADPPGGAGFPELTFTGAAPPAAAGAGTPCPGGTPVRAYTVRFSPSTLVYQDAPVLRDTAARVYSLDTGSNPAEVREPLVVRANAGECLEVTLVNATTLPAAFHLGELLYDPEGSSGLAVGFHRDSSTPAGGSRLYRFYADQDVGVAMAINLANPVSIPRGAYGAVVVEPAGSSYLDPATAQPIDSGVIAEITNANGTFRELVALIADEDNQLGQNIMPYPTAPAGLTGLSYSANPLGDRASGTNPEEVFSSTVHGDPRLVLQAAADTPITFRVGQAWGGQTHVFSVEGHTFPLDAGMTSSEEVASRLLVPGYAYEANLVGGAGAGFGFEGDYLFFDNRDPFTEAGLWGILRVGTGGGPPVCELAQVGESCSTAADCCSGNCSGGRPATRVCLDP